MSEKPDPRIAWHAEHSGVSGMAARIAILLSERGMSDASHQWEARNAKAVDSVLAPLLARIEALEIENRKLRNGCSEICAAIGNGSAASPDASVEFLTTSLANEVRIYCLWLRQQVAEKKGES